MGAAIAEAASVAPALVPSSTDAASREKGEGHEGNGKSSPVLPAVHPSANSAPRNRTAEGNTVAESSGAVQTTKTPFCYLEDSKRAGNASSPTGEELKGAPVCVEELKGALLKDHKPPVTEAKLWGHLHSENEKLASVIDAVGELGRHVRSPRQTGAAVSGSGGPTSGKTSGPSDEARVRLAAASAGVAPPEKKKCYSSVLASRPKHYKLYFV